MESKKLKVALLINSFNLGGAEKLVYDIASELILKNVETYVISMASINSKIEKDIVKKLKYNNIKVHSIDKKYGKDRIKSIIKIYRYIKQNKIDILNTHGQSPDFYGRLACVMSKCTKVVVTIHNTSGYSRKIEKVLQNITDKYTAVSSQTLDYAVNELGIRKNISIILNGIAIERYEKILNKNKYDKFRILTIGRIAEQKNYIEAIKMISQYLKFNKDTEWYIVGETMFHQEYFNKLKSCISEDIKDQIIFTGVVENTEFYYKQADCFWLNSTFEGFGIAFIEAIASKLPVICYKVGVIPEIIDKGGNIFLLEQNKIEYYLEKIKNNSLDLNSIKDNNYKIIKNNYSINAIAEEYYNLYKEITK